MTGWGFILEQEKGGRGLCTEERQLSGWEKGKEVEWVSIPSCFSFINFVLLLLLGQLVLSLRLHEKLQEEKWISLPRGWRWGNSRGSWEERDTCLSDCSYIGQGVTV